MLSKTMQAQQMSRAFTEPLLLNIPKLPPAKTQLFERRMYIWSLALDFVCKEEKWLPNYKIPCKRSLAKILRPQGIFLRRVYWLCKECHAAPPSMTGQEKNPYDNAFRWFEAIFYEILKEGVFERQIDLQEPIEPLKSPTKRRVEDKKRYGLRNLHRTASRAAAYENPFLDCRANPASVKLMETAIAMAGRSEDFRNEHYRPFIKAWRDWLKSMESPEFTRYFIKDEVLYAQSGRGKHAKNLAHS